MNEFELDYRKILVDTLFNGTKKQTRTNIDTICSFNKSLTIDLNKGFPVLTGRKIFVDKAYHEYIWIREGLTTINYLNKHNIYWWDKYADERGYLGNTYGYQLRSFNGEIDQLEYINSELKQNSRRAHITLWNPSDLKGMVLPPCYTGMTFMLDGEGGLNMSFQMRSSDLMLGLPYDIICMAFLLTDVANFNDLKPKLLGVQITDGHIYDNQVDSLEEYIQRDIHDLPTIERHLEGSYKLINYNHEPHIKVPFNI